MGKCDFTVFLPSLFVPDGSFYIKKQRKQIQLNSWNLKIQLDNFDAGLDSVLEINHKKAIKIDGMTFINKVSIKTLEIDTCLEFAECIIGMITNETIGNNEVRIIVDRYNPKSLKLNTRATRTKRLSSVRYKIFDTTKIEHLEIKELTSSVKTQSDLTE